MTQTDIDQAVARATGESLQEIRRRGFSINEHFINNCDCDPEPSPQLLDWDDARCASPIATVIDLDALLSRRSA